MAAGGNPRGARVPGALPDAMGQVGEQGGAPGDQHVALELLHPAHGADAGSVGRGRVILAIGRGVRGRGGRLHHDCIRRPGRVRGEGMGRPPAIHVADGHAGGGRGWGGGCGGARGGKVNLQLRHGLEPEEVLDGTVERVRQPERQRRGRDLAAALDRHDRVPAHPDPVPQGLLRKAQIAAVSPDAVVESRVGHVHLPIGHQARRLPHRPGATADASHRKTR